jgi:hypothetical protein
MTRHKPSNIKTSQKPRRLLIRSMPIMENGSRAKKTDREPIPNGVTLAEPPPVGTES